MLLSADHRGMPVASLDSRFAIRTKGDYERMAREIEWVVDWLRQRPAPSDQRAEALARIAADMRRDVDLPAKPDTERADADSMEERGDGPNKARLPPISGA